MKKAFTLAETVVAMAVIGVISFGFFTLANSANAGLGRAATTANGVLMAENVKNIFDASNFVQGGQFVVADFEANLAFLGLAGAQIGQKFAFGCKVDNAGNVGANGKGEYKFLVENQQNFVCLNCQILYNGKIVYIMPTYQKAVEL